MSVPGRKSMYDDISVFFGTSPNEGFGLQSKLFVSLNYSGNNFGVAPNEGDVESIKNKPIWQLMLAKNHVRSGSGSSVVDDNVISTDFLNFVLNVGVHHKNIDRYGTQILEAYANCNSDAKTFFDTHIVGLNSSGKRVGLDKSTMVQDIKLANFNTYGSSGKTKDTIFSLTLPKLPRGCSDETGFELDQNALREIYNNPDSFTIDTTASSRTYTGTASRTYTGTASRPYTLLPPTNVLGPISRGPGEVRPAEVLPAEVSREGSLFGGKRKQHGGVFVDGWDLVPEFVQKLMLSAKSELSNAHADTPLGVHDLATGATYKMNKDGKLVRVVDGKEVEVKDDEVSDRDTSYSTRIKNSGTVYECLLSGDKRALYRCIDKFSASDMFNVPEHELTNVHPTIVKKLLDTFHVSYDSKDIEHYTMWLAGIKSRLVASLGEDNGEEVYDKLIKNQHLLNYIRGLINLVNKNKIILQDGRKDSKSTLSDMVGKTYIKDNKLKYFYKPSVSSTDALLPNYLDSFSTQLRNISQNQDFTNLLRLQGVVPGMGMPFNFSLNGGGKKKMVGGGQCESVKNMRKIYEIIMKSMEKKGKTLVDADKQRIEQAFQQLEKNNNDLDKYIKDLAAFVRLSDAVDIGLGEVSLKMVEDLSQKNISTYKSTVSNLQNCVSRITRENIGLMTSLIDQVLRPLSLTNINVPTAHLRIA